MKSCISFSFPSNYNKKIFLHNIKHNIHKYPFYYVHKISPHWDNPEIIWSLYFSWNIFELSCSVSQKQSQPRSGERLCDKSIFVPWNVPRQEWKLHAYYSLDFCISDSNYFSFSLFEKILFINIYINICEASCITRSQRPSIEHGPFEYTQVFTFHGGSFE